LKYVLLTNGTLLNDAAIDFLIDNRFDVQLSFDGVPAAQDLRARGSFRSLDRLLDRLRKEHRSFYRRRLSIATTVVPRTVGRMADSFAYFLEKGISDLAMAPALSSSNGWNPARIVELEAQYARICRMSVEHFRRRGKIPFSDFRGGRAPARRLRPSRAMCGVMQGMTPSLDVDGEAYGCSMLNGQALSGTTQWLARELRRLRIGNLRDPAFFERLDEFGDRARTSRFLIRKEAKRSSYGCCRTCPAIEGCGVCPVSIGLQRGNRDPDRIPDFNCAFARVTWKARQRFLRESASRGSRGGSTPRRR
jgi:sulfatase maturation enzyme AslB (radical SAM superfamily)